MTLMTTKYLEVGICGLSCKLCPAYHRATKSKCDGCKSKSRMNAGCTFIRCAKQKKNIEFCWDCTESKSCDKWKKHREFSKKHDSFVCYQKLNDNIFFIENKGIEKFCRNQNVRKKLLEEMLEDFNEGRSKSYYCIAATVIELEELKKALSEAREEANGLDVKAKSKILHLVLDEIAEKKKCKGEFSRKRRC